MQIELSHWLDGVRRGQARACRRIRRHVETLAGDPGVDQVEKSGIGGVGFVQARSQVSAKVITPSRAPSVRPSKVMPAREVAEIDRVAP